MSSAGLQEFLTSRLGAGGPFTNSPPLGPFNLPATPTGAVEFPVGWIQRGSRDEDGPWSDFASKRSSDHFYTLRQNRQAGLAPGLSDRSETLAGWLGITNSFAWATNATVTGPYGLDGPPGEQNLYRWPLARDYQYYALINGTKTNRDGDLAGMLCALGHIIHLNQDLSQPEHVRNDEHFIRRCIEHYGQKWYRKNPSWFAAKTNGWPYWRDQGFTNLLCFWDRGRYTCGNAAVLDADAHGESGAKLGLAEFSNGNFLGQDATYAEFFTNTDQHYFPLPSVANTTQSQSNAGLVSRRSRWTRPPSRTGNRARTSMSLSWTPASMCSTTAPCIIWP